MDLRVFAIVVTLSTVCCAQNSNVVPPSTPQALPIIRLQDGSITGLGPVYINGTGYWVAQNTNVTITISAMQGPETFGLIVRIQNDSANLETFDPAEVQVFDLIGGRELTRVLPDKLAARTRRPGFWRSFAEAAARGMALAAQETQREATSSSAGSFNGITTAGTTFSGRFDAVTTTSYRICDDACIAAKIRLQEQYARADAARQERGDLLESLAIQKNTLVAGRSISGLVFFATPKVGLVAKRNGKGNLKTFNVGVRFQLAGDAFQFFFPTDLFDLE